MTVTHTELPPTLLGGTAIKPPERKGWDKIRYFLHDPEHNTFCTRTCKSWFLITLFFTIYYFCLAAFWYGLLNLFFLTLPDHHPKYELEASIIGTNPGVGIRPHQHPEEVASSMFVLNRDFTAGDEAGEDLLQNAGYVARIDHFLDVYQQNKNNPNATACSGAGQKLKEGQFCKFDLTNLGPCANRPYGYDAVDVGDRKAVNPCIYLKMNKIFNWVPEPIKSAEDLPEDASQELKDAFEQLGYPDQVTLHCEGQYPSDDEQLDGKIDYYPNSQGIALNYFPYNTVYNNEWPLVAIQLKDLTPNVLIHVTCKAYFKGVFHSKKEKLGMVRFEVLIK